MEAKWARSRGPGPARRRGSIEMWRGRIGTLAMATVDGDGARRATNRLSGFLTSLIHRPPRSAPRVPPSPEPAVRPATPPPALPAPTLHELGLELAVVCPAPASTPPTSGAFLAPHFLLLCHPQGLDVLPLRHPTPTPYPLVRRVPFKSVVVMEQRAVLVAVAGRRDGVRVYALDDIKKSIAWHIDQDARRQRHRPPRQPVQPQPIPQSTRPLLPRSPTPRKPRARPPPYETKSAWAESSDDEAINIVAAEASGSQALDERTSPTLTRRRPSNLDLSLTRTATVIPPEPSPTPTLLTLRHALSGSPTTHRTIHTSDSNTPLAPDDDDQDDDDGLTLAQVLSESRRPDIPPAGTRQPQQPILLSRPHTADSTRRRRWSALLGSPPAAPTPPGHLTRSQSFQSSRSVHVSNDPVPKMPQATPSIQSSRSSRFIPRILTNAFVSRKSQDRPMLPLNELDNKLLALPPMPPQTPAPKLDYVKLPGTKGALMLKAVETPKKRFVFSFNQKPSAHNPQLPCYPMRRQWRKGRVVCRDLPVSPRPLPHLHSTRLPSLARIAAPGR